MSVQHVDWFRREPGGGTIYTRPVSEWRSKDVNIEAVREYIGCTVTRRAGNWLGIPALEPDFSDPPRIEAGVVESVGKDHVHVRFGDERMLRCVDPRDLRPTPDSRAFGMKPRAPAPANPRSR